jgi:hypothetical protein
MQEAVSLASAAVLLSAVAGLAVDQSPAAQSFRQEIALKFDTQEPSVPSQPQLIELGNDASPRAFGNGTWVQFREAKWQPLPELAAPSAEQFTFVGANRQSVTVDIPWNKVRQIVRHQTQVWLITAEDPYEVVEGKARTMGWPSKYQVRQAAASPEGQLWLATSAGLFQQTPQGWRPAQVTDGRGCVWAAQDVLGVAFDTLGRLWFATQAGVGCRGTDGWRFYEGQDGLPWNDFTGISPGPEGTMWFGTRLGAIIYDGLNWHYRQGPRWLPHDEVLQIAVDPSGNAWLATSGGLGGLLRRPMTLAEKAEFYETEIERYIKRTSYGYVAEAPLQKKADKTTANPQDSDNDGLWTAMYGAGECFAYGATQSPAAKTRAKSAFEALRFLQKVTQGGEHSPPKGFVARSIRPRDWPDPNAGGLDNDRRAQHNDRLWKIFGPRWPKSADGQWFWKCDTSSDELDGHYFFYPLYYDFCADTDAEKERVREVVRDLSDHLLTHGFDLIDHDGKPTRWAVYGPQHLNRETNWWVERGLNSLSILSYLSVATHVTGDPKYENAARKLVEEAGYAQNAMYPKVQSGPGSGNQSDDEMAFMCFYSLMRYSRLEAVKSQIRYSFFMYWANEAPEMNPFFNFSYAAQGMNAVMDNAYGRFPVKPWGGWLDDAMATLYGFPLDRLNWPHRNSHRLDLRLLTLQGSVDLYEARQGGRGYRNNGKVLPIENRHFGHWNTDPWHLDYGGDGNELAAGTVFLLPYYQGLYHGFIEKPATR